MRLRRAFGVIAKDVALDPSISTSAKALYLVLCAYADDDGVCIPSNETLATGLGCTERAVQKWVAELADHGVLIREKRHENGRETTSRTRLTDASSCSPREESLFTPEGEREFTQNKTTMNKTSGGASRATPAPSSFPLTEQMWAWWRAQDCSAVSPTSETAKFLDYHRAKGTTFKDWTAAWRTWMRKAIDGPPGQPRRTHDDKYLSEDEALRRMR